MRLPVLLSLAVLFQQHASLAGPDPFQLAMQGKTLAALELAERALQAAPPGNDQLERDTLAILQTFAGQDERALATFDAMDEPSAGAEDALAGAERLDALAAILAAARGRRVVILNEAHHVPHHRAFSLELARALRREGFTHFAAETFLHVGPAGERRYPDRNTGFYSLEPVFGDLVRQALALGYQLVPYEVQPSAGDPGDMTGRMIARETFQAEALAKVLESDPGARLFVHCGYSHATENERTASDGRDASWMAARLGKRTGLDPLSIDQTGVMERSALELEHPAYILADEAGLGRGSVFRRADGSFALLGSYAGQIDLQVFLPRTTRIDGRPDWMFLGGEKKAVAVPEDLVDEAERLLVQAFVASEGEDAVPADQIVLEPGAPRPKLVLRPGEYRLVLQDRTGAELVRSELRVD